MPLRRTLSAPALVYPAMLLRAPPTRRNNVKSARRNAAHRKRSVPKKTHSKLPNTKTRKSFLAREKALNKEIQNLQRRIPNVTNVNKRLELIMRLSNITKRRRARENARRAERNEMMRREMAYNNMLAGVGIHRGLSRFAGWRK